MSQPINDGGPVHPCVRQIRCGGVIVDTENIEGMTLRDFFAATIPLTDKDVAWIFQENGGSIVRESKMRYLKADQMIKARAAK